MTQVTTHLGLNSDGSYRYIRSFVVQFVVREAGNHETYIEVEAVEGATPQELEALHWFTCGECSGECGCADMAREEPRRPLGA